ncbi:MAG: PAS domain S-box protein [Calditrichia bacterium]
MEIGLIIGASILFQVAAVVIAVILFRDTGRNVAWIFIAAALLLMVLRRSITFVEYLNDPLNNEYGLLAELVALGISLLLVVGLAKIGPFFRSIQKSKELLAQSEKRYRLMFENNPQPMLVVEKEGLHFAAVNTAAVKQYGYSLREFLNLTLLDIRPPEDIRAVQEYLSQSPGDMQKTGLWRHKRKDGTLFYEESTVFNSVFDGRPVYIFLINDVTERMRIQKGLQEKHLRLELLNNIATNVTTGMSLHQVLERTLKALRIYFNEYRVSFSTIDEIWKTKVVYSLEPRGMPSLIGTETHLSAAPEVLKSLRSGEPLIIPDISASEELRPLASELETAGIRALLNVPLYTSGGLIGILAFHSPQPHEWTEHEISSLKDIGEYLTILLKELQEQQKRKKAEEALQQREAHYRLFFQEDLTGDFIATVDGKITECNPAFARMFGEDSTEDGCKFDLVSIFPGPDAYRQFLLRLREAGKLEYYETEFRKRDGEPVFVIANFIGSFDQTNELREIKGYIFDITGHKNLEQQFFQAQRLEAIGRLAGGVAHDFNNILTVIRSYSELLMGALGESHPHYGKLEQIKKAGDRAASLTTQLLAFSRKQILKMQKIHLNELLRNLGDMLYRLIGEDIEVVTDFTAENDLVRADPGQVEQIVMNLVVNARDAMPEGGTLTLRTENREGPESLPGEMRNTEPDSCVVLSVSDTGIGMDEKTRSQIFEPFFTTKGKGKGTGLGLSTVYGIVQQSGGYILAESEPGKGSTFKIFFPLYREEEEREEETLQKDKPDPLGTETVLLVEDDEMVRELSGDVLRQSGYKVLAASNGIDALQICEKNSEKIQILVTDVVMPGMSGKELADQLTELHPDLKVLFMSGYTDDAVVRQGVLNEGLNFLQKPFSPRTLAIKIREVLDGNGEA